MSGRGTIAAHAPPGRVGLAAGRGGPTRRRLLALLRREPGAALPRIAATLGLTRQGVVAQLDQLVASGLVVEMPAEAARRGRPARRFAVDPAAGCSIGLALEHDLAGAACIDLDGRVRAETALPLASHTLDEAVAALMAAWHEVRPATGQARLIGAGLGVMGPLDREAGRLGTPPHRPGWANAPIARLMAERLGVPVYLDNSATAAALGESWSGAARRVGTFLYLFIGYGLGGAIVEDGRLVRGAHGNACEIGHVTVDPAGARCGCGARGCLETKVSLMALRAARPGLDIAGAAPADVAGWLDDAAASLAAGLRNAAMMADPAVILIGGRLPPVLLEALIARTRAAAAGGPGLPPILAGQAGASALARGAASLPLHDAFLPLPQDTGLVRHEQQKKPGQPDTETGSKHSHMEEERE